MDALPVDEPTEPVAEAPTTDVVELRVHGVGGPSADPESILDGAGQFATAEGAGEVIGGLPAPPDHSIADPCPGEDVLHTHVDYPDDAEMQTQTSDFVSGL